MRNWNQLNGVIISKPGRSRERSVLDLGGRGKSVAANEYYYEAVEKSDKTPLMCNFDRFSAIKILLKNQPFQKLRLIVFFSTPNGYFFSTFTLND